jgi:uncharacterized protein (TIGR03437 family)
MLFLLCPYCAPAQVITTVAGTEWLFPSNTLPALNAPLGRIESVYADAIGNVYIADGSNNLVVRVSRDGVLAIVAGNGFAGFSGDGGAGSNAALRQPVGMTMDRSGNLYFADSGNDRIRKVSPNGVITTVAGSGDRGFSGDGGPATKAMLNEPTGIAVDPAENVYFADFGNHRVRRVSPDGTISTVAGNGAAGFSGDGGPAASASLRNPAGVVLDTAGNLYFADSGNNRIRQVSATNATISTIAGNGAAAFAGDGGPAASASLVSPYGITMDPAGDLFIADNGNNRIRKVAPNRMISTVAGNGVAAFSGDGGPAANAALASPFGAAVDPGGNLLIADYGNMRVRKVAPNGTITTMAGNGAYRFSGDNGPALSAALDNPEGLTVDRGGNLYFADTANNRVRKVAANGTIGTVAGNGLDGFSGDNVTAAASALSEPGDVSVDGAGNLYIAASGGNRILKVSPGGTLTTVAGNGAGAFSGDGGSAAMASLHLPSGVAVDSAGNLYIADAGNNRIRRVTPAGTISTVAGNGVAGFSGDGGMAANAALSSPSDVTVDGNGNLYVADTLNNRIRKITPNGTITTLAGDGASRFSGDGGPASGASLNSPYGVAVDGAGGVYIADSSNNRVRKVTPDGIINTVAGNGTAGFLGDGGPAIRASLTLPVAVAVDAAGSLYISDYGNHRIRKVVPSSGVSLKISTTSLGFSGIAGGTPPPVGLISVSASITGVAFTAASSDDWLSVTPAGGSAPSTLQVSVDPSGLTPGDYQGTITISAPDATPSRAIVNVTFTVQPATPPMLNVSSRALSLTAPQGSDASSAPLQIQNVGGGALPYSATFSTVSGGPWLSISPSSGVALPAAPATLTVAATPGSLGPGTYQGNIAITGAGTTIVVNVTLSISAPSARIILSQSGLAFNATAQGGAPLPQSFGVLNIGSGAMDWAATATTLSGSWLKLTPASGTVTQPYLDVSTVNVSIDPTGLSPGDYYGRIQVSARAANSPQLLTVTLTVLPPGVSPGPEVRPAGLIFTGIAGVTPGSQDVLLGNPKSEPDSYSSGQIGIGFSFLPTNATVLPNQPVTLRVFPDFSRLQPGTINRGVVNLLFSDGTPRNVTVLTVVAPSQTPNSHLGPQASNCANPKLEITFRNPSSEQSFSATIGKPTTIEVQVADDCGNIIGTTVPPTAAVTASFSNRDPDLHLTSIGAGIWQGSWRPVNGATGRVSVSVFAINSNGVVLQSGQNSITGMLNASSTPVVTAGGVVHAATDAPGAPIAPGSLISIYGSNLADAAGQASDLPLPQQFGGARVLLGNLPLPILYASDHQLNVQAPFDTPINGQYQVSVQRDDLLSVPEQLVIAAAQPGVFALNQQGTGQGVIFKSDGVTLAQAGTPATAGETVVIYCTGLGSVTNPVSEGVAPPNMPLSYTTSTVTVTIGGQDAPVSFSGLTPGFPGLYQVNATVPAGVAGDAVPVVVTVAGQTSPPVAMAVQ